MGHRAQGTFTDPNPPLLQPVTSKRLEQHNPFIRTPKITAQFLFLFCSTDLQDCEPRLGWESSFSPCFWHTSGWPEEGASTPVTWMENLSLRCCQMGNICNQQSLLTIQERRKIRTENRKYTRLIKILWVRAHNDKLDRWHKQTHEKAAKETEWKIRYTLSRGNQGTKQVMGAPPPNLHTHTHTH